MHKLGNLLIDVQKKGLILLVIIIKEHHWFTQEYTAEDYDYTHVQ